MVKVCNVKLIFTLFIETIVVLSNDYIGIEISGVIRETNLIIMQNILQVVRKFEEERKLLIRILKGYEQ